MLHMYEVIKYDNAKLLKKLIFKYCLFEMCLYNPAFPISHNLAVYKLATIEAALTG